MVAGDKGAFRSENQFAMFLNISELLHGVEWLCLLVNEGIKFPGVSHFIQNKIIRILKIIKTFVIYSSYWVDPPIKTSVIVKIVLFVFFIVLE